MTTEPDTCQHCGEAPAVQTVWSDKEPCPELQALGRAKVEHDTVMAHLASCSVHDAAHLCHECAVQVTMDALISNTLRDRGTWN